ncbi:DUF1707 SHOCT-like domain-containing protein [Propionibacteriaceae bacterium Y1923]|uniref:DUF1707 SHOCT-like domain-containing protein n=1 Tax=Aestuariimicrobium sp. Y1814 TaxID=3418742 RepID=UPI003C22AA02
MSTDGHDRHLRVGTSQRELALEILRNAAAEDKLTFDELEARVPRALGAVTRADLVEVLNDLVASAEIDEVLGTAVTIGEGPGYTWDEPLVFESKGWSLMTIAGPWVVPPFLEVHCSIGGLRIDFSEARATSRIIDLVVMASSYGSTTIIVPEGWGVDSAAYQTDVNNFTSAGVRTRPDKGFPRVIVRGRTNGTVQVRHPKPSDVKHAAKVAAKGKLALPAPPRAPA